MADAFKVAERLFFFSVTSNTVAVSICMYNGSVVRFGFYGTLCFIIL